MNCTKCGTELKLVFEAHPLRHDDWTIQYDNALAITFDGGYGMFDDPPFGPYADSKDRTAVLCHDCAHEFMKNNPWVPGIDPVHGHTHEGKIHSESI